FSSRRRHTRLVSDWSSDVCSSDLKTQISHFDYRNGVKPWQWDPTKWLIWVLSKLSLTSGLRRVPAEEIYSRQASVPGFTRGRRRSEERRVGKEGRYEWARDE